MPNKVQSQMLTKGAEQGTEQDTEQGARLSTDLFLANSRSLTITQFYLNVSNYAACKNTKWATTPQPEGNT